MPFCIWLLLMIRFIARSSATIVMTGCFVHSEVLHFFSFKVIIFKYWHILCGTTGQSVPLHRLYLTCVVISGPGLESNQDTKYLSVTTRNCRTLKPFVPLRLHMIYIYIYAWKMFSGHIGDIGSNILLAISYQLLADLHEIKWMVIK